MPKVEIDLPTLHSGQIEIYKNRSQFDILSCGRRYGKTKDMMIKAAMVAMRGKSAGIFTPEYRQSTEPFLKLKQMLYPLITSASRNEGSIRLKTGGQIDFWVLNDNDLAGRGREYHHAFIDEAAFTKNGQMFDIWEKSIMPTLLTTDGKATVYSTPNGKEKDNFFYKLWHDEKYGFKRHHAPTSANPYVKSEYLQKKKELTQPLVFRQEYLAEFVDWSGVAFFSSESLTINGAGVVNPQHPDYVFATIDSAMKDGSENDGTGVIYWAVSKHFGNPLIILDWDIVQINSDLLTNWLPKVFERLEYLAADTKSRMGSAGAFIEDKGSGITLNQTAERMEWPAQPIKGDITSIGKDGRAISAASAVYRGEVKISAYAYDKVISFKGSTANHLLDQVCSFRVGDKEAAKRADDLLDCFTYGVIIALGGQDGF